MGINLNHSKIVIKDLVLPWSIGVFTHEKNQPQRVRISLTIQTRYNTKQLNDNIKNVISYANIVDGIKLLSVSGHINLVETLAQKIAALCLSYSLVYDVLVRVEKLDVYENVESVGIEAKYYRAND